MKRSQAARYARWSAAAALLLAGATAVVYMNQGWKRHLERKKAPPPAPLDVSRLSNGISFKQGDKDHTIFAVEASRSTEFKDQDASLLEDVRITIFGKNQARHDTIHTRSCQYSKASGGIACSGEVQIDLLSSADAARTAGNPAATKALTVHVETRGVTFDRGSGMAKTDQQVAFAFPSGSGNAVGMEYSSDEGTVRLLRDVRFTLVQLAANGAKKADMPGPARFGQEVRVQAASLDFGRDTRLLRLRGPAEAQTLNERLTAGEILLALDQEFHAEKLIAGPGTTGSRPVIASAGPADQMKLDADALTAYFSPGGDVTKVEAGGKVHGFRNNPRERNEATAEKGTLDLWPKAGQPKQMNLSGGVILKTEMGKTGSARLLRTDALQMKFSQARQREPSKLQKAETLSAGAVEWTDAPAQPGTAAAKTNLQAGKLEMDFGAQGKARQLLATGNVQTRRWLPGHAVQTATANSGVAELLETGGWSRMNLQGSVKLADGARTGQAERAVFERVAQTATLTGQAVLRDATTETRAPQITIVQTSGDMQAQGGVRSTDFSLKGGTVQLASAPANILADTLQANAKTGRALYAGHARLWQGDSVMEAESIELLRETRELVATGNVRAVFPQTAAHPPDTPVQRRSETAAGKPPEAVPAAPAKKTELWHATCGELTYLDAESRAHLQRDVTVQSAGQRMRGPVLDLYFTRQAVAGPGNARNLAGGAQQITRAVATGGVLIEQGHRQASAERGEYTAADGKFVMSGGNPTLYDGAAGTTTGRQLTFFLADDTIIVDSEKGSQTVTKHRVQE